MNERLTDDVPRKVSDDGTRAVVDMPFGVACYRGGIQNGEWVGVHDGVVGTVEDAEAFLRGEDVKRIRLYPAV